MKARSPDRAREMRTYGQMVEQYLQDNPGCAFPLGCDEFAAMVHHTRGRRGWRLLYVPWWRGSCAFHNDLAETDTGTALAIGWLHRVEGIG